MAGFSNYMEGKILNWMFENTTMGTALANIFVSLHSADPLDTGADELTSSYAYARVSTAPGDWNGYVTSGTALLVTNSGDITFPEASGGNWNGGAAIGWFGLWDAGSSGNFVAGGTISPTKIVNVGDVLKFVGGTPTGNLSFSVD
jgi:hypothetical protein